MRIVLGSSGPHTLEVSLVKSLHLFDTGSIEVSCTIANMKSQNIFSTGSNPLTMIQALEFSNLALASAQASS